MLFPMGSVPNAPHLETRKALLLIDLQNDFLREDGKLFVKNAKEFLPKLSSLVAKFREKGDVFWAQTEFQEARPIVCHDLQSYVIVSEDILSKSRSSWMSTADQDEQHEPSYESLHQDCESDDPEAYLAQRSKADWPRCCLPSTSGCATPKMVASIVDHEKDSRITKTDYSAFQARSLLPAIRMKLITQLYLCGSLSNISVYATALDAVRHGLEVTIIEDCVGYRSARCHEEAMRLMADGMGVNGTDYQELMDDLSGNLGEIVTASTFRSSVGLRQGEADASSEHYSMRGKVKRGMDEGDEWSANGDRSSPEDSDGFKAGSAKRRSLSNRTGLSVSSNGRQEKRPSSVASTAAQKRSSERNTNTAEPTGTRSPSSSRPPQNAKTSRIRVRRSRMTPEAGDEKSATAATATATAVATADNAAPQVAEAEQLTSLPSLKTIEVDPDPDRSRLIEMTSLVEKAKAFGRTFRRPKHSVQPDVKILGPGDFIGERDSRIIYDFLPTGGNFDDAFVKLRNNEESGEVRWQEMYHRSGKVPRLVAVQGEVRADGSIPIYRHPADESPPLLPFSATVQRIREEVEKTVGHPVNHVLIQLYRGGEDNISEHSDKTLDIVRGSFIVNVSLGAMRTMTLRTKKSAFVPQAMDQPRRASAPASSPLSTTDIKRTAQRIRLPHNSLFILGQETNQIWLHAIRADKRPVSEKTAEELAFNEERISLTYRHIDTFINPKDGTIWGQGATSKSMEDAKTILKEQEADKEGEEMIRAFGQENHQSHDFDWQIQYGAGFDVVNFATREDVGTTG
jgi:nicotinamidase-related amidase